MEKEYQKLASELGSRRVKFDEPMSLYTTFKIGGSADLFYDARTTEETMRVVEICRRLKVPYFILGGGSNLLVSDKGIRGVVIKMSNDKWSMVNGQLIVGAGVSLNEVVEAAAKHSLSGLEFAVGIPGTLGGAIAGNAGAWQQMISDRVLRVKILDNDGQVEWVRKKDCRFDYRQSRFKKSGEIVLAAELKLLPGNPEQIRGTMRDNLEKRKSQPIEPSAGSIFVNPKPEAAGQIIEQCGLRGYRVGDAQISNKHANFIVNLGGASCRDVLELISLVKKTVEEKFGIKLEEEVKVVGEF